MANRDSSGNVPRPPKPTPAELHHVTIHRVQNGYIVDQVSGREPYAVNSTWVFESIGALNRWLAKRMPQP